MSMLRGTSTTVVKYFITFMCYFRVCAYVCAMAHMQRSEVSLKESVVSFHCVGSGIKLKSAGPFNHLAILPACASVFSGTSRSQGETKYHRSPEEMKMGA